MSSTSKERLQSVFGVLDTLFANAHAHDRPELVKDLREYISRQNSAAKQPAYDHTHANAATNSLLP